MALVIHEIYWKISLVIKNVEGILERHVNWSDCYIHLTLWRRKGKKEKEASLRLSAVCECFGKANAESLYDKVRPRCPRSLEWVCFSIPSVLSHWLGAAQLQQLPWLGCSKVIQSSAAEGGSQLESLQLEIWVVHFLWLS